MTEWIVDASMPTRTMQRAMTGEVTRCLECPRSQRVGDMTYCHYFRIYVPERGYCWVSEGKMRFGK